MSSGCSASSPELTSRRHFRDSEGCHGRAFPANRVTAMRRAHHGSVCKGDHRQVVRRRRREAALRKGWHPLLLTQEEERAGVSSSLGPLCCLIHQSAWRDCLKNLNRPPLRLLQRFSQRVALWRV